MDIGVRARCRLPDTVGVVARANAGMRCPCLPAGAVSRSFWIRRGTSLPVAIHPRRGRYGEPTLRRAVTAAPHARADDAAAARRLLDAQRACDQGPGTRPRAAPAAGHGAATRRGAAPRR